MKLIIKNFKSIKEVIGFEIKPITILCGTNSSGKSSLIQAILLLKQSLQYANQPLTLNNSIIKFGDYSDIVWKHNTDEHIELGIFLPLAENAIPRILDSNKSKFSNKKYVGALIDIKFGFENSHTVVRKIQFSYQFENEEHWICFSKDKNEKYYSITSNSDIFNYSELVLSQNPIEVDVTFNSFIPNHYSKKDSDIAFQSQFRHYWSVLNSIFSQNVSYIGPLRHDPQSLYVFTSKPENIGQRGENFVYFLETEKDKLIDNYRIANKLNTIKFERNRETVLSALKYWICDYFEMAKDISVERQGSSTFQIVLTDKCGIKVPIQHTGFGISQILPVVIEGLRMNSETTLILEQPEIHLHPKLQSHLFDFLYSLTLNGKKIIIETHSDHLITRMKRRIAEDTENELQNNINLTFIEERENENIFRTLNLTDLGAIDGFWPKNFIDTMDNDFRAIVKAQAQKRDSRTIKSNENGI